MSTTSTPADPPPIEIETHARFQEAFWRLQRWAWGAFALIVLVAVSGLGGSGGPLSRQIHQTPDGVQIETPRIARWQTSVGLTVRLPHPSFPADPRAHPDPAVECGSGSGDATTGATTVSVSRAFLEHFLVEQVHPEPQAAAASEATEQWRFLSSPGSARIQFEVRPRMPGRVTYRIRVNDGPWTPVTTLVLP